MILLSSCATPTSEASPESAIYEANLEGGSRVFCRRYCKKSRDKMRERSSFFANISDHHESTPTGTCEPRFMVSDTDRGAVDNFQTS